MSINFDTEVSRLGTGAEKYESRKSLFGKADVEPFWVADMDLPSPPFLQQKLAERVAHPMFGYTTTPDSLLEAITWWWRHEHQAAVETDWIRLSPSVVTSISLAVQSMSAPGDGVVILSPVYGPFFFSTELNQRRILDVPLKIQEGQYTFDFDALQMCFEKNRPSLLFLCSPHNPGGRVWSEAELRRLAVLCNEYHVRIFSDEIHCDIVYAPYRHFSLLRIEEAKDICIVAHSIGKTFNASGLCASLVVIPSPTIRKAFVHAQEQSHCGTVNLLGKAAMEVAFSNEGAAYKQALLAYLKNNVDHAVSALNQIRDARIMTPQATFLVWCDFRAYGKWPAVMKKLIHQANVALSGGTFFGTAGEGFFRLNIAHPSAPLLNAVSRIVETMNRE
ncbi:MAG: PatB family C-S lyase [Deltaproteobacteria bacterium]|nr:PatB family C-S lyase [Deltaproteobacteria bacterium]MBN2673500.1 PatB family C-S lyase [Deltaproteobacteria bacterium]